MNPALRTEMTHSLSLLQKLIRTPSYSRAEEGSAELLMDTLRYRGLRPHRLYNNVWVPSQHWREDRPTLLLNSHHDTVGVVAGWQRDPHGADMTAGQLFGLGSNDAGASLVSLLACFLHFESRGHCPFNLVFAASAEEEVSGKQGMEALRDELPPVDLAIVGEPTQLQMAIAEKGLLVIDGTAYGSAGHAARNEGENALYIALEDIQTLRTYCFAKTSPFLGPVQLTVTQINAGSRHNVVPDRCAFVIDVRSTEQYSNEEIFEMLQQLTRSDLRARSFRLRPSGLRSDHPIVRAGRDLGLRSFGSPTMSDQALMPFPSLKIGPGDSARSHTADEYICISEIKEGIELYERLITSAGRYDWKSTRA